MGAARQENSLGIDVPTSIQFDPRGASKFQMSEQTVAYENEVSFGKIKHHVHHPDSLCTRQIEYADISDHLQDVPFALNVTVEVDGVSSDEDSEPVVIAPGETSIVSVSVMRCPGKPTDPNNYACENPVPATNARVLVVAVDKAYLELSNVPLADIADGRFPKPEGHYCGWLQADTHV